MEIERRALAVADFPEAVAVEDRGDGRRRFRGYAAVFDRMSQDLGGFREVLLPGAFDAVLSRKFPAPGRPSAAARRANDCIACWNHDPGQLLGRTSSGTLTLETDDRGLLFGIDPPDTQLARDLGALVARGDVYGASFAFTVDPADESFAVDESGQTIRTIRAVSGLFDVSLVTTPAYLDTVASLRKLEVWRSLTASAPAPAAPLAADPDALRAEVVERDRRTWRSVLARTASVRAAAEAERWRAVARGG
jgi:HK97 family phage prohead protease